MGHVEVKATFCNLAEYLEYKGGRRRLESVRKVESTALVDRGATFPALPEDSAEQLGLPVVDEREAETAEGIRRVRLAANSLVQIEDKTAEVLIMIRPKGMIPLIGVTALEQMGYRVDPVTGKLVKGLPFMI